MGDRIRQAAKRFEDLIVWQKSHVLVLTIYRLTKSFPTQEQYGLISQIRRSIVSVPANIAEGFRRLKKPDKARFLNIAQGSLEEVRYYMILSKDLGYLSNGDQIMMQIEEVGRLLEGYYKGLLRVE
ncbi:MAG: four helix bundle protein [Sedimentisphaerales bacterium]|nr:four helix bundle protein [Sedimentisphaerales bacterium]